MQYLDVAKARVAAAAGAAAPNAGRPLPQVGETRPSVAETHGWGNEYKSKRGIMDNGNII